jgi:hypothetical protein
MLELHVDTKNLSTLTISTRLVKTELVRLGANLDDSESVKTVIANILGLNVGNGT